MAASFSGISGFGKNTGLEAGWQERKIRENRPARPVENSPQS
jgi:hypothetical protein